MKILVVDDNSRQRAAAQAQLGEEHDLILLDNYEDAIKLLKSDTDLDVLLSDLLMPAEPHALGPDGFKFLGQEVPIGFVLALRAAMVGVKKIAVITDTNHHNHPMSAALDWINPAYWHGDRTELLAINNSQVLIAHAPFAADGSKDWGATLNLLLH